MASIVNTAGRQRMLGQRIVRSCAQLAQQLRDAGMQRAVRAERLVARIEDLVALYEQAR